MQKILPRRLKFLTVSLGALLLLAVPALIQSNTAYAATCDNNDTVIINCGKGTNGIWAILLIVINIMSAGVGILAVGGIVYGAILFTTAEDKADQVSKAKGVITNVVIGLVAFALMYAGLQFILPGGVFDRSSTAATAKNTSTGGSINGSGSSGSAGTSTSPAAPKGNLASIKSVRNVRDASASNSVLKSGVLFRSAQLKSLSSADAKTMASVLGANGTIIDLRTGGASDKAVSGARNVKVPIEGVTNLTPLVTNATDRAQVGKALKAMANAPGAVLVHCIHGKDRTGWIVAMIMYANGATDNEVLTEYLKSNGQGEGVVKKEWLTSGVQAARSKYGSINGYLKAAGLTTNDLNKLKTKFGA
jgi:hypothetical protein